MASSDEEIVVRLRAQTDELNAGMAQASATVRASSDAMAASFKSATASFAAFDAIQKVNLKTAEQAAQAQAAINAVQQTGAFTAEELAAKQALVDAAMLKMGKDTEAAAVGLGMFTRNSRTMYSTSALFTDAMTGQFSRMRREVAALGNETGLMAKAFQFAVSPVGLVAAAVVALGVAAEKGASEFSGFQQAIELTNGAAGVSAGDMVAIASRIGALTGSYGDAQEAVEGLAASGRFAGTQLEQAATAAAQFASATGMKVSEVEKFIEEMATNPKRALDDLENKYHAIDSAQADQIRSLLRVGDQAGATAAELDAFAQRGSAAMDDVATHARGLIGVFDRLGAAASSAWAAIKENMFVDLGGGDAAEQLDSVNKQIATMKRLVSHGVLAAEPEVLVLEHERSLLQQQVDAMHEKETAAKQIAAAEHLSDAPEKGSLAALRQQGFGGVDLTGNLTKQMHDLEAIQKVSYANREDFESQYWGEVLHQAQAGSAAYIQAWEQTQSSQKRIDDEQKRASDELARKREENARKAAEVAKQTAAGVARAQKQATDEFTQEVQKETAARLAADKQTVDSAHDVASARIAAAVQGYKLEADAGQITSAQLLRGQITGLNEQLAADIRHYQRKAQLAAGDAAEQMKWNTAIVIDKEKTEAKMLALEKAYQTQIDRINREIANSKMQYDRMMIDSGFREANALIGQQETFKQAVLNVGLIVLERQEDNIAKGIAAALSGEQAKTAAVVSGGLERVAANAAAEAESLAVHGAAAVKWIMTEAAKAAASAFNALAGIPVVGPVLAVGASIAAFAAVAKLVSSVASAEGGWERVPADGIQTILHKDEMVLPASVANPVRNMAKSGGGGGNHYHFNIQAYDRRGLADFVARNGIELGNGLRRLGRNGHTL